jgi:serine/threonine protein kinase
VAGPTPKQSDFAKLLLPHEGAGKQPLSQSSGFSTFDNFSLKLGSNTISEPLRLDQMVTLAVFKSTSGTIKKMLHGPSLKIYCVKEVPLANRETRQILKEWLALWDGSCTAESFVRVHETFWNSPEGCVSVVQDFAAKGSLYNLVSSVGALPESTLQHLARQVIKAMSYLHD